MASVRLHRNAFERWIIVDARDPTRGWSGSRFVEINPFGLGKSVQVSNFTERETAKRYAELCGLEVLEE